MKYHRKQGYCFDEKYFGIRTIKTIRKKIS